MTTPPLPLEPDSSREIELIDLHPPVADFRADAVAGLTAEKKRLSPKYFYDEKGSALFERITRLPEYYPTRTEIGILEARSRELGELLGPRWELVELGSGSSRKVRILLDSASGDGTYVPIDISREHLIVSAEEIAAAYPGIRVVAVCADYTDRFDLDRLDSGARRIIFFPGSTIGNLEPAEARVFLSNLRALLSSGDRMIIGVDLQKDPRVLHAAYNDAAGVTARFNLNLLERMNRQLRADFDVRCFEHTARYDPTEGRIEMHLRSRVAQQVRIGTETIRFAARETILTEYSYKYTRDSFRRLTEAAGLGTVDCWTDDESYFSVWILEPEADREDRMEKNGDRESR